MSILSSALSGARSGVGAVKRLATMSNANKLLVGANRGLKTVGYLANNVNRLNTQVQKYLPPSEIGNNLTNVLNTAGKLAS